MPPPTISVVDCTPSRTADAFEWLDALTWQIDGGRAAVMLVDGAPSPVERDGLSACRVRVPGLRLMRQQAVIVGVAYNCASIGGRLLPSFPGSEPVALRSREEMGKCA